MMEEQIKCNHDNQEAIEFLESFSAVFKGLDSIGPGVHRPFTPSRLAY